jgi:hypothetical protein
MPRARPFVVGGVLGSPLLYLLISKLPDGAPWGLTKDPGIDLGVFVALGSFTGSLVFGVADRLLGGIAASFGHYWCVFEAWSKFRLGRIPPEQYYAHGAALDYQHIYRHTSSHDRPETQDQYVRCVILWRMKSSQGTKETPCTPQLTARATGAVASR